MKPIAMEKAITNYVDDMECADRTWLRRNVEQRLDVDIKLVRRMSRELMRENLIVWSVWDGIWDGLREAQ